MRTTWFSILGVALVPAACTGADGRAQPATSPVGRALAGASFTCTPLQIDGGPVRVATDAATSLHTRGGSGTATFRLEGTVSGASIEPGGGLRSSRRAATFQAVASDGLCKTEARVAVAVIGPFDVQPESIVVARGAELVFQARGALGPVHYVMLDTPGGGGRHAVLQAGGKLSVGDVDGTYHVAARDVDSGKETRVTVTVGKPVPLRPRSAMVFVPAGGRARLDFRGGSARVEPTETSGNTGAKAVLLEDGDTWLDARGAHPGVADVTVKDRFTRETAKVRVVIGATLGDPPIVRGTQSQLGDMASGDVNGDGRPDLVIGHAERSKTAFESGGILVYHGDASGGLQATPALSIEGALSLDHYGAVLAVRDVNGDGIDDVVTGVPDSDLGDADRGAVALHLGSKEGLEVDADRVLSGEGGGQRFGSALALADLDGDGAVDLVTSAPSARNPFAAGCEGRIYVYKNRKARRGVFATIPSQVIDVKAPLGDAPEAQATCGVGLGAGRALALVDVDGDGVLDLAVGAPRAKGSGIVLVYRGMAGGAFEPDAGWAIQPDPALKGGAANFGEGLDVVAQSLVVRAPNVALNGQANAGGFWIFPAASLGAPGKSKATRVVDTRAARAFYMGTMANRGVGRSAVVTDVDPEPGDEYVVGASAPGAPGGILLFSNAQLTKGVGALTPLADLAGSDYEGFRITRLAGGPLAVWAPWRTTHVGSFAGAIDLVASPVKARWTTKTALELPSFGAGDRAGTSVALATFEKTGPPRAVLAAPGAHSPLEGAHAAGERLRAGTVGIFGEDPKVPLARIAGGRNDAQLGAAGIVALDFDGDGIQELAIADPNESAGGPPAAGVLDPDGCSALDAKGQPIAQGGRGVVHVYAWSGGRLVERWRLTAGKESPHEEAGAPKYTRGRFGFSMAAADVNGDGKDDLIIGRPGSREASGAEVVLGRKADPGGKVLVACGAGETRPHGALEIASSSALDPVAIGAAVARVGDLDKDGCDEVALSLTAGGFGGPARAGVALAFGYDPSGLHCQGHRTPLVIRLVPDDHPLRDDVVGEVKSRRDDANDLRLPVGMGRVLAQGGGDFTGDGVPDLVYRDVDLPFAEGRGPAVEILSGAFLAGLCPNHVCARGAHGPLFSDGEYHVLGVRSLAAPTRRIVFSGGIARGFGASLVLADLTGDGVAELAIGSTDESDEGPFAGEVRIYRGGTTTTTQDALLGDPYAIAVGDTAERASFGASLSMSKSGWLLVGAPTGTRWHLGGNVGGGYLWRVEIPK